MIESNITKENKGYFKLIHTYSLLEGNLLSKIETPGKGTLTSDFLNER